MTAAQTEALTRLLDSLPIDEGTDGATQAPGLGYRGFTIQGRGTWIAAFRGRVSVQGDGAERRLSDPERTWSAGCWARAIHISSQTCATWWRSKSMSAEDISSPEFRETCTKAHDFRCLEFVELGARGEPLVAYNQT
jgi:hypothetical protein